MLPSKYLESVVTNVVKRSGICRATVEAVLPALFDEIRYQLTEGTLCVPIESFGTFCVVDIPERQRHYTYKGTDEIRTLPPKRKIKFSPTRSFTNEVNAQRFDETRRSFQRHPDDPAIRYRTNMLYSRRSEVHLKTITGQNIRPRVVVAYEEKPERH